MNHDILDYLIIGPAHPYRGGIADTQHELAKALQEQGKTVKLITFTTLYPKFLFPGSSPLSSTQAPKGLNIKQYIHAYLPFGWKKVAKIINDINPKTVVFRYYTPFLAPVYGMIAKNIKSSIKKISFVDNWIPHETKIWDPFLNRYFGNQMEGFTTLSANVANQVKKDNLKPVWTGFHPISSTLSEPIDKSLARKKLAISEKTKIVLFFGLIRKYKGLELIIKAFNETSLKNTNNIVLYIAGECYEDPKKYTDLVTHLGIDDRIIFDLTFKNSKEISLIFSASDIVAQTYHSATQSGVTPLAYFYQKPILVSDIKGLRTPIEKDKTGEWTSKEPKEIAANIKKMLEDNNYRRYQKKLVKVKNDYLWSSFVKKWDTFIETI
jgi:glycosyltransferase involved in cell wall biosynthesis